MFEQENPIFHKRLNSNKKAFTVKHFCRFQRILHKKKGSFVVRNLRANFHFSLLLTVNFMIYFHATVFLIIYLVKLSIRNVHDKIMPVSSVNVNLHQVLLPIHFCHFFSNNNCNSKLVLNGTAYLERNHFLWREIIQYCHCLDIRTVRRHSILLCIVDGNI